jgi:cell division transport system permease protein
MILKKLSLTKAKFLIKRGLILFRKNLAINLTSIVTIVTALYIFFLFFTLSYSIDNFFDKLVNVQNIRAYLKTYDKTKVDHFINSIKKLKSVETVKFFSQEDAYLSLKKSYMGEDYLGLLPKEFFPSFIEITLKDGFRDIRYVKEIETEVSKFDIIDVTSYGGKWLLNFLSVKIGLKIFVLILTLLLSISIGSVIYNTINLNLFKFKEELKIYSLVGATRSFISVPYILSSLIEANLSFFSAFLLQFATFKLVNVFFLEKLGVVFLTFPSFSLLVLIYFVIITITTMATVFSLFNFLDKMGAIGE